jgi:hypothetical protein
MGTCICLGGGVGDKICQCSINKYRLVIYVIYY